MGELEAVEVGEAEEGEDFGLRVPVAPVFGMRMRISVHRKSASARLTACLLFFLKWITVRALLRDPPPPAGQVGAATVAEEDNDALVALERTETDTEPAAAGCARGKSMGAAHGFPIAL